jgi:hypothetical protein
MRLTVALLAIAVLSPALASQPGQPLDCSDWVFLEPGYSCIERLTCDDSDFGGRCYVGTAVAHIDVASAVVRAVTASTGTICGHTSLNRVEVFRETDTRTVIGYIDDRCVDPATDRIDGFSFQVADGASLFDASRGQVVFPGVSYSAPLNPSSFYPKLWKLYAIAGFATTFDVLQTYSPPPSELSFRVPYMPEGLGGADHFDTYWGPLTKPIDFTQAHPLQCGYPATPPHVGDYETVADTLPTPAPDSGYYYLTATTYQGQTRDGRKTSGGKLSGRDPALLPACVQQP